MIEQLGAQSVEGSDSLDKGQKMNSIILGGGEGKRFAPFARIV